MAEVGNILETFGTSRGKGFEGFSNPAYTMVPDELLDHLMVQLPLAELRIVLYICRRTFGFKKNEDAISISQMLHGIRKKDGTVLDYGVGIAKSTLMLAIRSLVEKGIIIRRDRVGSDGGSLPTVYSLRFKSSKSNDSNRSEGGVPKVSTPGVPDSSTEGVPEIGTDNKQVSKNSYSTPPSTARKWAENFYEKLGRRVSEVKLKRGAEEVQELLNNGFSEADIEYAVSYVTTVYPDTQSIARLSFLIDEALDVQKRGEEKSRREAELQLQVKNSEKDLEIRKLEQDENRKAFEALPEEIQQAWIAKAPRFMRLESSRMAWAIGQFKQQKVGPESGPGNGPHLDHCLDRSQNFQEIEIKKDLVNFVMPKFTDLPPDPTPPTNYIVVGDWGRGGDLGGVEEKVKSEGEMK